MEFALSVTLPAPSLPFSQCIIRRSTVEKSPLLMPWARWLAIVVARAPHTISFGICTGPDLWEYIILSAQEHRVKHIHHISFNWCAIHNAQSCLCLYHCHSVGQVTFPHHSETSLWRVLDCKSATPQATTQWSYAVNGFKCNT